MELALVGALVSGVAQIGAANQQAAALKTQAKVEQQNAARQAELTRRSNARQLGQLRARVAKSGATMEGSPLMALAESTYNAELNINADLESARVNADLMRQQASGIKSSGMVAGIGTMLTGAGNYAGARGMFEPKKGE